MLLLSRTMVCLISVEYSSILETVLLLSIYSVNFPKLSSNKAEWRRGSVLGS